MAFTVLFYCGLALMILGALTWRYAGRELLLGGATLAAISAYATGSGEMRTSWLVAAIILTVVSLLRSSHVGWRRPEIISLAGLAVAVGVAAILQGIVQPALHNGLLALVAVLGVVALALTARYLVIDIRRNRASNYR